MYYIQVFGFIFTCISKDIWWICDIPNWYNEEVLNKVALVDINHTEHESIYKTSPQSFCGLLFKDKPGWYRWRHAVTYHHQMMFIHKAMSPNLVPEIKFIVIYKQWLTVYGYMIIWTVTFIALVCDYGDVRWPNQSPCQR
jgi:hypothetical protein